MLFAFRVVRAFVLKWRMMAKIPIIVHHQNFLPNFEFFALFNCVQNDAVAKGLNSKHQAGLGVNGCLQKKFN